MNSNWLKKIDETISISMTRPDLAKFHEFVDLMRVYLVFGKTLNLFWSFFILLD